MPSMVDCTMQTNNAGEWRADGSAMSVPLTHGRGVVRIVDETRTLYEQLGTRGRLLIESLGYDKLAWTFCDLPAWESKVLQARPDGRKARLSRTKSFPRVSARRWDARSAGKGPRDERSDDTRA